MTSLQLESVTVQLGDTAALRDVSLTLVAGARLAVVGASGSGKSTLLRAIVGLLRADEGTITLDDRVVTGPTTFVPAHRRRLKAETANILTAQVTLPRHAQERRRP